MMRRRTLGLLLAVLLAQVTAGQESAFTAHQQPMARVAGRVEQLFVLDGELYCYAAGVLQVARREGEWIKCLEADTTLVKLDEGVTYAVRHPESGSLYYTVPDKNGTSVLYEYRPREGKRGKTRKVKMEGMSVEHPVFTPDGNLMVFVSNAKPKSQGGYDLWYSERKGEEWGMPRNFGSRVNTRGDERWLEIYDGYLLFASDGHVDGQRAMCQYATRLLSDRVEGDTVGMLQIGRSVVQQLPVPLNATMRDSYGISMDEWNGCGYWVSQREGEMPRLLSIATALNGVRLWGRVTERDGTAVGGAAVVVRQGGHQVCSTVTDGDGFYQLYLHGGERYTLQFRKKDHFSEVCDVATPEADGEHLIADMQRSVTLGDIPYGRPLRYDDIFGPDADVQLSEHGREVLGALIRFVKDNPHVRVEMVLSSDLMADAEFNALVTDQRVKNLEDYVLGQLPPLAEVSIANGCRGQEPCLSATGRTRLAVTLTAE